MNETLRFSAPISLAAAEGGRPRRLFIRAYNGDAMRPWGFGDTVTDLAGMTILDMPLPILDAHENSLGSLIGQGQPRKTGEALDIEASILPGPAGERVVELLQAGAQLQASIGLQINKMRFLQDGETVRVNGREVTAGPRGLLVVEKSVLRETSILPAGADAGTSVRIAARLAAARGSSMDANVNNGGMGDQGAGDILAEEQARVSTIEAAFGRYMEKTPEKASDFQQIRATAIADGWDPKRAEVELMRKERMLAPMIFSAQRPTDRRRTETLHAAALCATYGLNEHLAGKVFDEETMNRVQEPDLRGLSLHALCRMTLQAAGESVPFGRLSERDIRRAFYLSAPDYAMKASVGPSTISLPGILGDVARKSLLASFLALESTWPAICRVRSADNFHIQKRYRMAAGGDFEEVPPGGELKHGTLTEESQSNQLKTYGKLFGVDRRDVINDDLQAFTQIPALLARMSQVKIEKATYELILANAGDFFGVANGNLLTASASAPLSANGLGAATSLFRTLKGQDGNPIMVSPSVLLVGPSLEATALSLTTSLATVIAGVTDRSQPDGNIWAGRYKVVVAPYLDEANGLTNANDDGWYLVAQTADLAIVEICFLNGQASPTIETAQMDFERLGITVRAYHDFGLAFADKAAGVFSDGTTT